MWQLGGSEASPQTLWRQGAMGLQQGKGEREGGG